MIHSKWATFSVVANVKHNIEDWNNKKQRECSREDTPDNFRVKVSKWKSFCFLITIVKHKIKGSISAQFTAKID